MINSFQTRFNQRVTSALNRTFGVTADYIRGSECFEVTVLADASLFSTSTGAGDVVAFKTFDFLIDQVAEPFQGPYFEPQRKDKIQLMINGRQRTFESLPEISGKCFESEDIAGTKFRLRMKEKPS